MTVEAEHRCPSCDHYMGFHFRDIDVLGSWGFCGIIDCDCFWDVKKEEDDYPPLSSV